MADLFLKYLLNVLAAQTSADQAGSRFKGEERKIREILRRSGYFSSDFWGRVAGGAGAEQ